MAESNYNKLVRDNIPQIIEHRGAAPVTRILELEEYKRRLLEKLIEEAEELLESNGSVEERADIAEVLAAIDKVFNMPPHIVEEAREAKARRRGKFTLRILLEKVIEPKS